MPELEIPRVSTGGRRAEGDDMLARGAAIPTLEATATPSPETAPTVTATLKDGPLQGGSIEVEMVEGRPPKTIDVPADDGSSCRYCLAGWVQSGRSAAYTFLYRV
jgi:hypothetical protein